ncbi:hypothetical protein Y919_01295 [Caloranaerobacter azorensis H53214]|uniref:Uncharacterized protein n=1 Tax=Caloranaerobacter azorensis H53214 TaxID=1156417 RepID=A0A096BKA2_9FIRM|nr:hypothetical protein [Caloranaerobacter azorensis]KGG81287.1 hypothetical protein Y919_01295 [Caloranaerobacter azorensis H53214]
MSVIENIGLLDTRNIKEDLAKEITKICNVGILIESNESQLLLKNCEKVNVGLIVEIPKGIQMVTCSGILKMNRNYLEGLLNQIAILVNGTIIFEEDIDSNLINEKIYCLIVNGRMICPERLNGVMQSKSKINGQICSYKDDYILFGSTIILNNQFLYGLKPHSKLAIDKAIIIEDVDMKLFEERVSNIQILDKLVIADEFEKEFAKYINEYYLLDKTVVPKGSKYIEHDIKLNDNTIKVYNDSILFVDGEVEIYLEDDSKLKDHIKSLICDSIVCRAKNYEAVKGILGNENIEIEIIEGKLIKNTGKMVLSGVVENVDEGVTIRNMGKLVIDENIDVDVFNKKVKSILNFGLIVAPEKVINIVRSKIEEDYGRIKMSSSQKDNMEANILYSNTGELIL